MTIAQAFGLGLGLGLGIAIFAICIGLHLQWTRPESVAARFMERIRRPT